MTTEKMLRMKILSNVMLIVAVLLLLVGIGVFFGPTLKYEAELSQSNQEYEELAEQQLLPADQTVTDQVETATDSGNNDLTNVSDEEAVEQIAQPDAPAENAASEDNVPSDSSHAEQKPSENPATSDSTVDDSPSSVSTSTDRTGNTGADLAALKSQNADFAAWLQIPGTNVNYPVVCSDNTDYYLTHTFNGTKSSLGTLFSLGKTSYSAPSKNIAIYGHHISGSGQKMFKPLLSYKDKEFWSEHSTIYLDSLYDTGTYRVFAVINMEHDEWDPSTADFASSEEFMAFINRAKEQALYDNGVTVSASDHILTLITCDRSYAGKDGRLVVMAVKQ